MGPMSRIIVAAATAAFVAIVGIAAQTQFGLFNGGASGSAAEAAFTQELAPGDILHIHVESFRRYGPKFSQIADGSGIPTEDLTRDAWWEVGDDLTIRRSIARTYDANGTPLSELRYEDGTERSVNLLTGDIVDDFRREELPARGPQELIEAQQAGYMASGASIVQETPTTVTLEMEEDLPPEARAELDSESWTVPYINDLRPLSRFRRVTFHKGDQPGWYAQTFIRTESGALVRISEATFTFRVLDEMPASVK